MLCDGGLVFGDDLKEDQYKDDTEIVSIAFLSRMQFHGGAITLKVELKYRLIITLQETVRCYRLHMRARERDWDVFVSWIERLSLCDELPIHSFAIARNRFLLFQ